MYYYILIYKKSVELNFKSRICVVLCAYNVTKMRYFIEYENMIIIY